MSAGDDTSILTVVRLGVLACKKTPKREEQARQTTRYFQSGVNLKGISSTTKKLHATKLTFYVD